MTDKEEQPYSRCTDCGEDIEEGEVYGEWDDLCESCFHQREREGRGS